VVERVDQREALIEIPLGRFGTGADLPVVVAQIPEHRRAGLLRRRTIRRRGFGGHKRRHARQCHTGDERKNEDADVFRMTDGHDRTSHCCV
jgi:hypothetical protein